MRTLAERSRRRNEKVRDVLGDTDGQTLVGSFGASIEDRRGRTLAGSVIPGLIGDLLSLNSASTGAYTVAITTSEVLLIRHDLWGRPKRIERRLPIGAVGPLIGGMEGTVDIDGNTFVVPVGWMDEARRILRH